MTEQANAKTDTCEGPRAGNSCEPRKDFGFALFHLNCGRKVSRRGWNGKGMWIKFQVPDIGSKMSQPYIFIKTATNDFIPWTPSQTDLIATDWGVERE